MLPPAADAPASTLAARVVEAEAGPARLLLLPTPVRDAVSFRGSFSAAPDFSAGDDLPQGLLADLLDKGTRTRDRFALAEALEDRGARLSFYSDGLRMGFAGRALREDLPLVLDLLGEQLREPALDADEFEKARTQAVAAVRRAREQTGALASGTLVRRLYPAAHPNYTLDPSDELAQLAALTPEHVRDYARTHLGADDLVLAFAGDLDVPTIAESVSHTFGGWEGHGRRAAFADRAEPQPPGREVRPLADRLNLDVRLGHAVDVRRDSPDYLALFVAIYALGGNFSGRLMQTVRDEQGLTYGIGAGLRGVAVEHDAHVAVSVTLSQENLARGIEATRAVVEAFAREGVGEAELARTQTTLAGEHVVALATTGSLAARLLVNAERGFPVSYLDEYPEQIRALTPEAVNEALKRYLRPDALHETISGTLPEGFS